MAETTEAQAPQYLSFTIAGTDYGLPILKVKEILQHEEPTRVPGAPLAFFSGSAALCAACAMAAAATCAGTCDTCDWPFGP